MLIPRKPGKNILETLESCLGIPFASSLQSAFSAHQALKVLGWGCSKQIVDLQLSHVRRTFRIAAHLTFKSLASAKADGQVCDGGVLGLARAVGAPVDASWVDFACCLFVYTVVTPKTAHLSQAHDTPAVGLAQLHCLSQGGSADHCDAIIRHSKIGLQCSWPR